MKKGLSFLLSLLMLSALFGMLPYAAEADGHYLEINESTFPDAAFRQWVIAHLSVYGNAHNGYYMTEERVKNVRTIDCSGCGITSLQGIESFIKLETLSCANNELTELDLRGNTELKALSCGNNHLRTLAVYELTGLISFSAGGQTVADQHGAYSDGKYSFDLNNIMPAKHIGNVRIQDASITLDQKTGVVTLPNAAAQFTYVYDAGTDPNDGDTELPELPDQNIAAKRSFSGFHMEVTVSLSYDLPRLNGLIEWNEEDVQFKGTTAYVIADGSAHTPRFTVKNRIDGSEIPQENYDFEYRENTDAGTGYVIVTFKNGYCGTCRGQFKIYLPATTTTTVANVSDGIKVTWAPVEGAAGYVIYRRAWSSTTNGWTAFARWDNTTETTYLDGHDASHKVFAGTRYQYGVKAYFERRTDPVTGEQIGGNVNNNSGNYNLGLVGPLKTTVRITTRTLNSVTAGTKQLTAKWGASSYFTGYQVQIATDSAFTKDVQTVKIANLKTVQTTIKNLKSNTTYYVRVRSYHVFEGTTYYGGWSNVKNCKVK